jgi:hypothetical protein
MTTTLLARTPRKTYRDIKDIASIPVPAATDTYCPVAQSELWDSVQRAFTTYGYRIDGELHQVHRKKPLFVSSMDVHHDRISDMGGSVKWTVAVMNSYDKSCSARIIFGGRVFVCSNGLIIADRVLRTKHTTHVWDRLPALIASAADAFEAEVNKYQEEQNRLKEVVTTTADLSVFTVNIARQGILPKSKMLDFYEEVCNPSFDYGTKPLSLWNYQAAFTHLAKTMNPVERPRAVMSFDKAVRDVYALA